MIRLNSKFSDIVESGSNTNGYYIKYSDGTLIQYSPSLRIGANVNYTDVVFPIPFLHDGYSVTISNGYNYYLDIIYSWSDITTEKMRVWGIRTSTGVASDKDLYFKYKAIGKWK